jgi:Zn-dependent M28 family amino/carboxypeptidase
MLVQVKVNLRETVLFLSDEIGTRSCRDLESLERSAAYIEGRFRSFGLQVSRQPFTYDGHTYQNVIAEVRGTRETEDIYVVGAHYDAVEGSPGADDNASGVAGLLELARLAAEDPPPVTTRFAAFSLEEPPVFRTSRMGSNVYAQSLAGAGVTVRGMICLEMIGYYSTEEGSQFFPLAFFRLLFPTIGNFVAFVGDTASRAFTRDMRRAFQEHSGFPCVSLNTVRAVPGIDFSDHSSFWKYGYPAFMVTDTAFYRNPHYHTGGDRPSTLNYPKMAEVVVGLDAALREVAAGRPPASG